MQMLHAAGPWRFEDLDVLAAVEDFVPDLAGVRSTGFSRNPGKNRLKAGLRTVQLATPAGSNARRWRMPICVSCWPANWPR